MWRRRVLYNRSHTIKLKEEIVEEVAFFILCACYRRHD